MVRFIILSLIAGFLTGHPGSLRAAAHDANSPEALAAPFFTPNMTGLDKAIIISAIDQIPVAERDDVLSRARDLFTPGMDRLEKASIIYAIRGIPAEERDDVLSRARDLFTPAMSGDEKATIINAICDIPVAERKDVLRRSQPLFARTMNGYDKAYLIDVIIRDIPVAERDDVLRRAPALFTQTMSGLEKARIIGAIGQIPAAQRERACAEALRQFLLAKQRGETEGAEGNVMLGLLQDQAPQAHGGGNFENPFEVHNYAETEVQAPSRGSSRRSSVSSEGEACAADPTPQSGRLNDVIMRTVEKRVKGQPIKPISDVQKSIDKRIPLIWSEEGAAQEATRTAKEQKKSTSETSHLVTAARAAARSQQNRALEAFLTGFTDASDSDVRDLCTIFTFIEQHHPDQINLWIQQFLGESMDAYATHTSCVKGIRERAVLGLRNMDPALDKIFVQVEGPRLAAHVFSNSNFGDFGNEYIVDGYGREVLDTNGQRQPNPAYKINLRFVANKLKELGYHPKTTPEQAGKMYQKYLQSLLDQNPSLKKDPKYNGQPELYAELIEGDLERGDESVLGKALHPTAAPEPKPGSPKPPRRVASPEAAPLSREELRAARLRHFQPSTAAEPSASFASQPASREVLSSRPRPAPLDDDEEEETAPRSVKDLRKKFGK